MEAFANQVVDLLNGLLWGKIHDVSPAEPLTDIKCLEQGFISHTILDYRRLGHG